MFYERSALGSLCECFLLNTFNASLLKLLNFSISQLNPRARLETRGWPVLLAGTSQELRPFLHARLKKPNAFSRFLPSLQRRGSTSAVKREPRGHARTESPQPPRKMSLLRSGGSIGSYDRASHYFICKTLMGASSCQREASTPHRRALPF